MPLNLIKLCVGAESVRDLEDWIKEKLRDKRKRGEKPEHIHRTRMVPKRADELTDGGSLYWVIRGEIMCRQRIRAIRPFRDKDGVGRCGVVLEPKVVLVAPRPAPATCRRRCAASCASSACCDHLAVTRRHAP